MRNVPDSTQHNRRHSCQGIKRVESLTALGDTINNGLSAAEHVTNVLSLCHRVLICYMLFASYEHTACLLPYCTAFSSHSRC